jgi:hypothetical protein
MVRPKLYRSYVLPCSGTRLGAIVISIPETFDWWMFRIAADRAVLYVMRVTNRRPVVD